MFVPYNELPEGTDRTPIARAAREIILALRQSMKAKDILENINRVRPLHPVSANAFKLFLLRELKPGRRINVKNNTVMPAVYAFIHIHYMDFPEPARTTTIQYWNIMSPADPDRISKTSMHAVVERSISLLFQNWLHIDASDIGRLALKFCGDFALLRKSSVFPDVILKSHLRVTLSADGKTLHGVHHFKERTGAERHSYGTFIPLKAKIYGIFGVERGEAIEFFSFVDPIQNIESTHISGLCVTIDRNRYLLSAKIIMERMNDRWLTLPNRIDLTNKNIVIDKDIMDKFEFLDKGTSSTVDEK